MDISISEYYIEERSSHSTDKENKCPELNVNEFRVFEHSKQPREESSRSNSTKSYVYSQVLSRRKIF
jgi:hypothetical protein